MSMKQNDVYFENLRESIDPFDGDQGNTEQGRALRLATTLEDCMLCKQSSEMTKINELLKDTMDFITNSLPREQ